MVQMFGSSGGQKKVEMEGVFIGKRVIETIEQYSDAAAARQLAARIIARPKSLVSRPAPPMTIAELCEHFQHREPSQSDAFRSHSTRRTYIFYLNKCIIPRWKDYELANVRTVEVEAWLRSLPLARSTCAKIRNLMSVVFNHACRHDFFDRNPISLVRQSARGGGHRTFSRLLRSNHFWTVSHFERERWFSWQRQPACDRANYSPSSGTTLTSLTAR
jgi:hypothetical protein